MTGKKKDAVDPNHAKNQPRVGKHAAAPGSPKHKRHPFPVVGIGASAGGLAAFEAFFSTMPTNVDLNMAFVLVQHLAPDHKSILTELVQRFTSMEVFEVEDGMAVKPNCAYIIPPNRNMAFINGSLQLLEPTAPRGQRLPIDFFFRSLASDQQEQAICVVLSGTGSDGTLGVRAIKGEGGMVMVQSPDTTEYDSMPNSAIATGLVDYILAPEEMPAQLLSYVAHAYSKSIPAVIMPVSTTDNAMKKIFGLLRAQTGNDFANYKPSTIHRRIERRMAVQQIDTLDAYVKCLQQTPAEVEALFRDMLIGVTSFFRDADAFKTLEKQGIPKLFAGKTAGSVIRVWTPGCSTGEEAYSIAILLQEQMEILKQSYTIQLFATDIDSLAIATARTGIYPASIATDVSAERLARFFIAESDGSSYRVHKGIRDMIIFSEQNMIKDPPFSKLDMISCRNLLIYMGGELQKKIIPLFHYALNPDGILFLGNSETVGEFQNLFSLLDRKARIYQRTEDLHGSQRAALSQFIPPLTAMAAALPRNNGKTPFPVKLPLRELTERELVQQVELAGVLVNDKGDILYLHGRTGMYLEQPPGEAGINNILKMSREGLRRELTVALHKSASVKEIVRCPGLRVRTNSHFTMVNLTVRPVRIDSAVSNQPYLYVVVLEQAQPTEDQEILPADQVVAAKAGNFVLETDRNIAALKQELRDMEEYLKTANEELETSNEELKSSNEEMQSVNEELQSTNEELETSKEELQSVNEELATVNAELQSKVADLSQLNNDMNNLLAGTGIGTVFVDHQLRVMRFTPAATKIINLVLSDVGRPVAHIVANLVGYDRLLADIQEVLDTLLKKEVEVQTAGGNWYNMRIMPYRTLENVIEGAVISFIDITEIAQTREALRLANEQLRKAAVGQNDGMSSGNNVLKT